MLSFPTFVQQPRVQYIVVPIVMHILEHTIPSTGVDIIDGDGDRGDPSNHISFTFLKCVEKQIQRK